MAISAPILRNSTPSDNASAVGLGSNIKLTFNENVRAGSGYIVISSGNDTRTIAITDSTQITFYNNTVTINPTYNLNPNATYSLQIASGVITNTKGVAYAGISDATTLNFTTLAVAAPRLINSSPGDDATAVAVGSNIKLNFNENVKAGTGHIVISDGVDTRTIAVTDSTQINFNNKTVTINPTNNLNPNATYSVQMASGVVTNTKGVAYAGLSNSTQLNFTTLDMIAPTLVGSTPADDVSGVGLDSNVILTFSENVKAGTGNIVLSSGTDTRTIAITDSSQVTFNNNTVTINLTLDLNANTVYSVQMASGVIKDMAGNAYAGISNSATFNFITQASTAIELSAIEQSGNNGGFVINGMTQFGQSGWSVSGAGDVNGDGLDDLIVGTNLMNRTDGYGGPSYVVFGKSDGAAVELSTIQSGIGGFVINFYSKFAQTGVSVSSAGDVNGDGLDDLIVGAPRTRVSDLLEHKNNGASYVVFGKSNGTPVELSSVWTGVGGFVINGNELNAMAGLSVSQAGDVNGDGLDDVIVGSALDASYVVFGKRDGALVELPAIKAGIGGFVINGVSAGDYNGKSVSGAGDVNGDGLDDLIVGAHGDDPHGNSSGTSFVVFGKRDGTAVELTNVENGIGGFVINGANASDYSGWSVSGAGDVNGDGLDDLIVGAFGDDPNGSKSGASYVVFGKSDGAPVELSNIKLGSGGFVINGVSASDVSGWSVSDAGDVNADGLDDLLVGAWGDDPHSSYSGASFVVYGKSDGAAVQLSNVERGIGGFAINGVNYQDYSGRSVSSAGDVNGDGFADLIIGAPGDDPHVSASGASFVVFGGQLSSATAGSTGNDTLTGDGGANQLVGGRGDDLLLGNGGADVLRGGAGDDILAVSDLNFASLDGGSGGDTLRFDAPLNLDLRLLTDTKLSSIEVIDLSSNSGNSTISFNITDILHLNEAGALIVHGNAGDTVNLDNVSNGQPGNWVNAGGGVYQFTAANGGIGVIGTATIDPDVSVTISV